MFEGDNVQSLWGSYGLRWTENIASLADEKENKSQGKKSFTGPKRSKKEGWICDTNEKDVKNCVRIFSTFRKGLQNILKPIVSIVFWKNFSVWNDFEIFWLFLKAF